MENGKRTWPVNNNNRIVETEGLVVVVVYLGSGARQKRCWYRPPIAGDTIESRHFQ